jgi:hypothetical protein
MFDAVVNHLDEVASAVRSAVQEALLGTGVAAAASGRARCGAYPRRKRQEHRFQAFHDIGFAADHQAVTTLLTGNAATGTDIDMVKARCGQILGAPNVVAVIRIAAVDHDVARVEIRYQVSECLVHGTSRYHQPDRPRPGHLRDQFGKRRSAFGAVTLQAGHHRRLPVMNDTPVALLQQAPNHARAHSTQTYHSELHVILPCPGHHFRGPAAACLYVATHCRGCATAQTFRALHRNVYA